MYGLILHARSALLLFKAMPVRSLRADAKAPQGAHGSQRGEILRRAVRVEAPPLGAKEIIQWRDPTESTRSAKHRSERVQSRPSQYGRNHGKRLFAN